MGSRRRSSVVAERVRRRNPRRSCTLARLLVGRDEKCKENLVAAAAAAVKGDENCSSVINAGEVAENSRFSSKKPLKRQSLHEQPAAHPHPRKRCKIRASILENASIQAQVAARGALELRVKDLENKLRSKELQLEDVLKARQDLADMLSHSESERRRIHEKFMTLRGNFRTFSRLKPTRSSSRFLVLDHSAIEIHEGKSRKQFVFDHVFDGSARQGEIFAEVQELVQSSLDGFNVCIFAYGQTGSGKTFTMASKDGIIPRVIEQVFRAQNDPVNLTHVEIYNEKIRDLVQPTSNPLNLGMERGTTCVEVRGATEVRLSNKSEALKAFEKSQVNREVGRTNMNHESSRGHAVFTLRLSNNIRINLIDLAGSERFVQSGNGKLRLKEQCHINSSLTTLKNVLRALSQNKSHIPFRDSKLTRILQSSLASESCKTLMIATVSQEKQFESESINTLRFASEISF